MNISNQIKENNEKINLNNIYNNNNDIYLNNTFGNTVNNFYNYYHNYLYQKFIFKPRDHTTRQFLIHWN